MNHFFRTLPANAITCFAPRFLPWHIIAIAITFVLVYTGADWQYFIQVHVIYHYFFAAAIIGAFVPVFLPLFLLAYSHLRHDARMRMTAWMLWQAALLGSLLSSFYKVFTGRLQPNLHNYTVDISHQFQFGILRHGIFWGWPSSHTTIAFAMAIALVTQFPKNRILSVLAILYAAFIGSGVSMSIHWLSDAVAGVLFGSVVGMVVGKSFKSINYAFPTHPIPPRKDL